MAVFNSVRKVVAASFDFDTDRNLAPALHGGQKTGGVRLPVYAPAWVRVDLVDELPRSRVGVDFWGWGGGGVSLAYPRDTTLFFRYLSGRAERILWEINDAQGQQTRYSESFMLTPLDTQRVRSPF